MGLLEPKPCVLALVLGVRGGVQEGHFGTGSGKGSARALNETARGRKMPRGDSATHKWGWAGPGLWWLGTAGGPHVLSPLHFCLLSHLVFLLCPLVTWTPTFKPYLCLSFVTHSFSPSALVSRREPQTRTASATLASCTFLTSTRVLQRCPVSLTLSLGVLNDRRKDKCGNGVL